MDLNEAPDENSSGAFLLSVQTGEKRRAWRRASVRILSKNPFDLHGLEDLLKGVACDFGALVDRSSGFWRSREALYGPFEFSPIYAILLIASRRARESSLSWMEDQLGVLHA